MKSTLLPLGSDEVTNLLGSFRPDAPPGTEPADKLRIPGSLFPEIGSSHSGFGKEGVDVAEKVYRIGHGGNSKSAIADSQPSSKAFVHSRDETFRFDHMQNFPTEDDGWRERLKIAIKESGRSQGDIATSCGLSRGYFTNVFRDGKEPTIGNLILIAREINVSLSKILYGYTVSPETEEILHLIENNPDLRDGILKILKTRSGA